MYATHRVYVRACTSRHTMCWLRLISSLQLYDSFAKEPYKRDYILQKRPVILRGLLIVATPYIDIYVYDIHLLINIYIYDIFISERSQIALNIRLAPGLYWHIWVNVPYVLSLLSTAPSCLPSPHCRPSNNAFCGTVHKTSILSYSFERIRPNLIIYVYLYIYIYIYIYIHIYTGRKFWSCYIARPNSLKDFRDRSECLQETYVIYIYIYGGWPEVPDPFEYVCCTCTTRDLYVCRRCLSYMYISM